MSAAVASTVSTTLAHHTDTRNSSPMDVKKAGLDTEGEYIYCFDPRVRA